MNPRIIFLILCSCCCQSSELQCDGNDYLKDGRCCSLCKPGQRLVSDCTVQNVTVCVACSEGEYQDKYNRETSCLLHKECNNYLGFEKISEGTLTSNVNCTCKLGSHCSSEACENCVLNTKCAPGEGVIEKAISFFDTRCSPCKEGTFSDTESETESCKAWSKCGESEKIKQQGTPATDVVCEPSPKNQSNTWVYVVVIMLVFGALVILAIFFIRRSRHRNKRQQNPPEEKNHLQLMEQKEGNQPEEDQDDQIITMQGLPVAQEQGKDYHISQEEV